MRKAIQKPEVKKFLVGASVASVLLAVFYFIFIQEDSSASQDCLTPITQADQ